MKNDVYFKREIEKDLLDWKVKHANHTVLEIRGSRQVGKTTTLEKFGKENYKNFIYLSLDDELGKQFFKNFVDKSVTREEVETSSLDYNRHNHLLAKFRKRCEELYLDFTDDENTLVVIDEIQKDKDVYELIRGFNRRMRAHVIVTGSYMSRAFSYFQPAGDVIIKKMYPLNFREFVSIFGAQDVYSSIEIRGEMSINRKDWFDKAFSVYKITGGYPDVIKAYLEDYSLEDIDLAFSRIINVILEEARGNTFNLRDRDVFSAIMNSVIHQLMTEKRNHKNLHETLTKEINTKLTNRISKETCGNAIAWLHECDVIVYCARFNLDDYTEISNQRYYFEDTGLLNYFLRKSYYEESACKGILNENYVCSTLQKKSEQLLGLVPHYALAQDYELDFVEIGAIDKLRYGIEVKSSNHSGKSVTEAYNAGKIDKILYLKESSSGGIVEDKITLPIWLLEQFDFNSTKIVQDKSIQKLDFFHD